MGYVLHALVTCPRSVACRRGGGLGSDRREVSELLLGAELRRPSSDEINRDVPAPLDLKGSELEDDPE